MDPLSIELSRSISLNQFFPSLLFYAFLGWTEFPSFASLFLLLSPYFPLHSCLLILHLLFHFQCLQLSKIYQNFYHRTINYSCLYPVINSILFPAFREKNDMGKFFQDVGRSEKLRPYYKNKIWEIMSPLRGSYFWVLSCTRG